jgi:hypothetical protein
MSYQIASDLCYFGTVNPKIREAITALLAGEHATACELLATCFIDTKEELDREQVAALYNAEENDRQIAILREQRDEAIADAKHQKAAADALKVRAEAAEAMAAAMAARAEVAEEQLDAAHEENRVLWCQNYSLSTQLDENEEELLELKQQLEAAKKSRKAIWGGGVVPLYEDDDEEETTYICPAETFKPLEFAPNGCLVGCDLCAANGAEGENDDIDRSELEDDMEMVATCYADGQPFCPEKPLIFHKSMTS